MLGQVNKVANRLKNKGWSISMTKVLLITRKLKMSKR